MKHYFVIIRHTLNKENEESKPLNQYPTEKDIREFTDSSFKRDISKGISSYYTVEKRYYWHF